MSNDPQKIRILQKYPEQKKVVIDPGNPKRVLTEHQRHFKNRLPISHALTHVNFHPKHSFIAFSLGF